MKTGNLDSKCDTDTTSPAAQQHTTQQNRSEARFLADQAANARTALVQTVSEIRHTLAKLADVRTCARQHPWIATGSVLAAGFVAGAALSSRRSPTAASVPPMTDAGETQDSSGREQARAKPGLVMSTLGTALSSVVQTLLQSLIATAVVATEVEKTKDESQAPGRSTTGHSTTCNSTPCNSTTGNSRPCGSTLPETPERATT